MSTAIGLEAPSPPPSSTNFVVHTSTLLTWTGARAQCASLGGQLARVLSQADQDKLAAQLDAEAGPTTRDVWIGAFDSFAETNWRWTDGSEVSFFAWGTAQPADAGNEDCVGARRQANWLWYDLGCDTENGYVCTPLSPPRPPTAPHPPSAPPLPPALPPSPGWPGSGTTFVLSTSLTNPDPGPLQWENARAYCTGLGLQLAVLHSPADQAHLEATVQVPASPRELHAPFWAFMSCDERTL